VLAGMAALVVATALETACKDSSGPLDPVWGKEPCAHCAMLVGDRRYAAQVLDDGDHFYFDDIGCMALWLEAHRGARSWVRGDGGTRWIEAATARYASGAGTPMDFGFEARAEGQMAWGEVRAAVLRKNDRSRR